MVNEVMDFITGYDKEVGEAIQAECARQRRNLELIASENIVSEPVMMAMGTVLTNKYAEGLRQCPAPCRSTGQHGGICRHVKTRGYGHGYESGPWRPSDPRKPS